jgi:hypothetical protein
MDVLPSMTISLREDERKAIENIVREFNLKRHEVVKLAIRYFLFPKESEHWLDGRKAIVENRTFSCGHQDRKIIITPDNPETDTKIEIISDEEAERRRRISEARKKADLDIARIGEDIFK